MIKDFNKIPYVVIAPDNEKIYSPKYCKVCNTIINGQIKYNYGICKICGHAFYLFDDTQELARFEKTKSYEGLCWCSCAVKRGLIKNNSDWEEFWKECFYETIGFYELKDQFYIGLCCYYCVHVLECDLEKKRSLTNRYCEEIEIE